MANVMNRVPASQGIVHNFFYVESLRVTQEHVMGM